MWRSRTVRAISVGYFVVVAFNGIDDVALVFLATDTLHGGDSAVGLLLGALGIGLFAGYALLSHRRRPTSMIALLLAGFAANSAGRRLLDLTGPRVMFVVAGTGGLLATLATAWALRRRP